MSKPTPTFAANVLLGLFSLAAATLVMFAIRIMALERHVAELEAVDSQLRQCNRVASSCDSQLVHCIGYQAGVLLELKHLNRYIVEGF